MMILIVILGVLSAMLNQQVEACWPNFARPEKTIEANTAIILELPVRVVHEKVTYDGKLLTLRANETENMYVAALKSIAVLLMPLMNMTRERSSRFDEFCNRTMIDYETTTHNTASKIKECVENQLGTLKSVEENIQKFLDERKSCALMYNENLWDFCSGRDSHVLEECIEVRRRYNSQTEVPHICDEQKSKLQMETLEKNLKQSGEAGISDATRCIAQAKANCETAVAKILDYTAKCMKYI